jgi:hypothetical protein
MEGDMRCEGLASDVRCDHEPLPGKTLCEYHDGLSTLDPAFRKLLDHLGKLLAREYVALQIGERTGMAPDKVRRLLR